MEILADIGGAFAERHERAGHGEIDGGGLGGERRNQLERIEPVAGIDHPCLKAHGLAGGAGAGMQIALGIDHHQRVVVVQDVGNDDPGGLVAGRGGEHDHVAVAARGVHGDESALALSVPAARLVGVEARGLVQRVGMLAQHDAALVAELAAHLPRAGLCGLRQALGFSCSGLSNRRAVPGIAPHLPHPCGQPQPGPGQHHECDHRHGEEATEPDETAQRRLRLLAQDRLQMRPGAEMFAPEEGPFGTGMPGPEPVECHGGQPEQPPEAGPMPADPGGEMTDEWRQEQHHDERGIIPLRGQRRAPVERGVLLEAQPCGEQHHQRDQHHRAG